MILEMQHRTVLHQDLADLFSSQSLKLGLTDAIAIHVVCTHVVSGEGLHPIDQRRLLDDVDLPSQFPNTFHPAPQHQS